MNLPDEFRKPIDAFPAPLRELIDAELQAGNAIAEITRTFPAPPNGACVKLAKTVTTRPRASSPGVHFREWNSLSYSGEFADAKRVYLVVEPPHPPAIEKNMDSIRAESAARECAANANRDLSY